MIRQSRVALLATSVALLAASSAFAAVDGPVQQARDLMRQGKARQAYELLQPLTVRRAGDADFDYALGIAAVDSGRNAEAIIAFQRVLAVQPNNAQARAELARAYAQAGDADTARKEFNTVVGDPTLPDPVRQRFNSIIGDLDRNIAGGGRKFSGYVEGGVGYDTNVNTATAATSLVIPLFSGLGPAALSGAATQSEDLYGTVTAGVSYAQGLDRQNRVFASLLTNGKFNKSESTFNTATATGTLGYAHSLNDRSVLSLAGQGQGFWLDGSTYRTSYGVIGQYTAPFRSGALSSQIQYYTTDYPTDPLRDGYRLSTGLSYAWDRGVVAGQYGREHVDSPLAQQFANNFGGLSAAFEYPLWGKVTAVSSLSGELRKYDAADPLFLVRRDDQQIDASFGLRIPIARQGSTLLTLRPQVTYTNNHSNIPLYQYDRVTTSIALRAEY